MTRFIFITLVMAIGAHASFSQAVDWRKTHDWKIYQTRGRSAFGYTMDTLQNFRSILLDNDSMQRYLRNVTEIPYEKIPMWMGAYTASCKLSDGTQRKIEIGKYGGFFFDDKSKKYFELPVPARADWLNYLSAIYRNITSAK